MAYKTPWIGSKDEMPGIIKDGKSGFTIPVYDHMKFAEKIAHTGGLSSSITAISATPKKGNKGVRRYLQ
ncbi:MAG: hypothetical protein ABSD92_02025 [Candidatus Bathyarchaeia archaeon]|jgi:hypothetical protein